MSIVKLNQKLKRVEFNAFELDSEIVFEYFNKQPADQRDELLKRAIYIGVLALMEDRLSAFLSKTQNELGTELENLKKIFEIKQEAFFKTAIKGTMAEGDIASFLNDYFKNNKMGDEAVLTGTSEGELPKNKTGDILCYVDRDQKKSIVLECKFDKSIKLGDIAEKDVFIKKTDTSWSQLIEARANRNAKVAIMVFDRSLVDGSIIKFTENVGYIPSIGFICIIDSQRGDYSNLVISYLLSRDIVINARVVDTNFEVLDILVKRMMKTLDEILAIRSMVQNNIDNNKAILRQLEKSMLLMEANKDYLKKFLETGDLSKEDLLDFYMGKGLKERIED